MGYVWLGENDWKAIRGRKSVLPRQKNPFPKEKENESRADWV